MSDSIFDIPENRNGSLSNLGIPSNKTKTNQTTQTDFDVYYNMARSLYTSNAVNNAFTYRAARDNFEFQNTYSTLLQSMASEKMLISLQNNADIAEAIAKAHDRNTDNMIGGHLGTDDPPVIIAESTNSSNATGSMLQIKPLSGDPYIDFRRSYYKDYKPASNNLSSNSIISVAENLYIHSSYILDLNKAPIIKYILDNMLIESEMLDNNGNILDKHIEYIMNKEGTRLDDHLKNNIIHINEEERNKWNETYDILKDAIFKDDLDQTVIDILSKLNAHTSNFDIHVTLNDKLKWDNKFDKPLGGIDESHLSNALVNRLSYIFSIYDIIDPNTDLIRDDLIPGNKFLLKEVFDKFREQYNSFYGEWVEHYNDLNINKLHITQEERNKWNAASVLSENNKVSIDILQNKINSIDNIVNQHSTLINNINNKIKNIESIEQNLSIHINNSNIHMTEIERESLNKLGDKLGDTDDLKTNSKTLVGAINEIYELLLPLLDGNLLKFQKNTIFDDNITI